MFLYLDTSALAKRYMSELGSNEVNQATTDAETAGTVAIARVEVAAALARAVRTGALDRGVAMASLSKFRNEWEDLTRIQVTDHLIERADTLAWDYDLRGYDAVHLAAALMWQEGLGEKVTLATFDESLWNAVKKVGIIPFPEDLSPYRKVKKSTTTASKAGAWSSE